MRRWPKQKWPKVTDSVQVEICGETLQLCADKAIYWPARKTLILTDPHFGKPASFRHAGIPLPLGTTRDDLDRLTRLVRFHEPQRIIILGDFFHHRTGQCAQTLYQIGQWREVHHGLVIHVVAGNHDRHSLPPPAEWHMGWHAKPLLEGPFLYCHEPCSNPDAYVLAGHIHPSITLSDGIGAPMRLPCFHFTKDHALLPAFGSFTGTATVRPQANEGVYAIVEDQVVTIARV